MLYIPMSDHPSNNSTHKAYKGAITVSITIVATKILAATLKTAKQNDCESDSSNITHMHIDAIHTYERPS